MKIDFKKLAEKVVETARNLEGIKEVKGNNGWYSKLRPKVAKWVYEKMKSHGWKKGQPWCAYFGELVWSEVYDEIGEYKKLFDKLFSGSAVRTYKKFEAACWEVGQVPEIGALIIWESVNSGRPNGRGHVGIVLGFDDKYIYTVEGNTNGEGSREGDRVAFKKRKYVYNFNGSGLRILGFVYAPGTKSEIPFKNRKEGNLFREWLNNYHSEYAKEIQLDRSGLFYNSFIRTGFKKYGKEYTELMKK